MQHPESKKRMVVDCIHYWLSSVIAENKHFVRESPKKVLTVLLSPLGWFLKLCVMLKNI